MYEVSRQLTSQVPLKKGETHCPYCDGFGGMPIDKNENMTRFYPEKCYKCDGKGKYSVRTNY